MTVSATPLLIRKAVPHTALTPPQLHVMEDAGTIDVRAFARQYVATLLRLEGVSSAASTPVDTQTA